VNVSIDKNAGYGYLSEFEIVVADKNRADETKALLRRMMKEMDIDELPKTAWRGCLIFTIKIGRIITARKRYLSLINNLCHSERSEESLKSGIEGILGCTRMTLKKNI